MKSETSATESLSNNKEIHDDNDNEIGNSNDLIIEDGFPAFNTFTKTKAKTKTKQEINTEPEPEPQLPRCPFASYPTALTLPNNNQNQLTSLLSDCEKAFTARTKDEDDAYSTGITFFLPAVMKPRCALESLARTIFTAHTSNLIPGKHYDLERSGAEWWTLVLDAASASASTETTSNEQEEEEDDEEYEGDEVGMHFDADYGLEQQLPNYLLHPRVATVTYLSDVGVPTLVLEKRSPPPSDVEKKTLDGDVSRGWLSCPRFGKHIAFDGRFLHGAPGAFFPGTGTGTDGVDTRDDGHGRGDDGEEQMKKRRKLNNGHGNKTAIDTTPNPFGNKRITFMVNVWINHCPIDAEPIDDELCSQMETLFWEDGESSVTQTNKPMKGMLKKGDDDDDDDEHQCQRQPPFIWNLKTVNLQGENEKGGSGAPSSSSSSLSSLPLVNLASVATNKSKDDEEAGSETTVICNREVTMNFRCTMKECHRVVKEAFDSKGNSVEVAFGDSVLRLEVGDEYVQSDSDGEDQDQES